MNIVKIVEYGLRSHGFDGLVKPGECGCLIGDLSPGGCLGEECHGGYKHTHGKTGEWIVSTNKDGLTDEAIQEVIDAD